MHSQSSKLILAFLLLASPLFAQPADVEPVGTVLTGERLNPALYGPGIVESMEDVLAREAAQPRAPSFNKNFRGDQKGVWQVPSRNGTYFPKSGQHNLVNKWGDTRMGIGFPQLVDVEGFHIAGQADKGVWARGVRVVGYNNGREVAASPWFDKLSNQPTWVTLPTLRGVDRIVFEAKAAYQGAGWYAIDDLTFQIPPKRAGDPPQRTVLDFEDCNFTQVLTGTHYAGLTWETGSGAFDVNDPPLAGLPAGGGKDAVVTGNSAEPRGGAGTTPTLLLDFRGVVRGDASQFSFPPDTCGAVGPNHFVVAVNRNLAIYNKTTGAQISNVSLGTFLPGSSGDPRVIFDQYSNRWIVIVSDFATQIFLAVSTTDNPTGSFFKTSFVASADFDVDCFPDYPTLGVDADGIYTGSFMAGGGGCANQMTIFAIDKAPLIAGAPSLGTVTAFRNLPYEQAIQPVHTFGTPAVAGQYFVSRQNSSLLRVRRLTGPLTSPTLSTIASVSIPNHSSPVNVPAQGSTTNLDSIDNRLMNAVYRNGSIWTCHHVGISGRNAVRWYEIRESPTIGLIQSGTVDSGSLHYWMPSIAVNSVNQMILGFSGSNASQFAAAYYCGRLPGDPAGQTSPAQLLKAGVAAHNLIDGFGRNRWGDYSLCSIDPADGETLWTIQEYVHASNTWGTWVGKLTFGDVDTVPPTPNPPSFEIPPTPLSTNQITMRAAEVIDDESPPVEYFFKFEVGGSGGTSSPWQTSRDHVDGGLSANAMYYYSLQARDSATPTRNTTDPSAILETATMIQTPTGIAFGSVNEDSISITATGTFSLLTVGSSGIFVEMTPAEGTGANVWVQTNTVNITGLQAGTEYSFRVKARNRLGVETPFVGPQSITTPGCPLLGDINGDTLVDALDIGGFVRSVLGVPEPEDNPICAEYGNFTIEEDVEAFVADLLAA